MARPNSNASALLALAFLMLAWGYSWIIMKTVMQYAGPLGFASLRYLGSSAMLLLLLALRRESLRPPPLLLTLAIGLSQTTAAQTLVQLALVSGGAGHVSMLMYTMPFWAVLLAWWIAREPPASHQWTGIALAAAGLICIMQPWRGLGGAQSTLLAITGGIFWALATVLSKRMFQLHRVSVLSLTTWQMVFGTTALVVITLMVPERPIAWNVEFINGLLYIVLVATSLGWVLWSFIIKRLPTTLASMTSLGVPVTAVLLAWLFLNERPNRVETAGICLIALGLLSLSGILRRARSNRTPRADIQP